ncbi:MAG: homocysteine S-methyltransferase family protein [Candidatus Neomarinimicrobiota bacterium]|nr:MAG: homocysteine S-methyltransferase family protein [Candidatus Neomarinimicrobiota bacterium]
MKTGPSFCFSRIAPCPMEPGSARPLVLDGALGTELQRRGIACPLPLWSAEANFTHPDVVETIHREYVDAGADMVTTNTFRTTPRTYFKAGYSLNRSRILARDRLNRAVELARRGAGNRRVWGSITTLEDCYHPELCPGQTAARDEYAELTEWFLEQGVTTIVFETMGNVDEIEAAVTLTAGHHDRMLSLLLRSATRLWDGTEWLSYLSRWQATFTALLVNCVPLEVATKALRMLAEQSVPKFGAYPNLGCSPPEDDGHLTAIVPDSAFLDFVQEALSLGPRYLGACCGSTPRHIRLLREKVDRQAP